MIRKARAAVLLAAVFGFCSFKADALAQETTLIACEDEISWCDPSGNVVEPTPIEIAEQCSRYPRSCKNGKPIELADSGCVDPEDWENYCTDQGKLRAPTAEEIKANGARRENNPF